MCAFFFALQNNRQARCKTRWVRDVCVFASEQLQCEPCLNAFIASSHAKLQRIHTFKCIHTGTHTIYGSEKSTRTFLLS